MGCEKKNKKNYKNKKEKKIEKQKIQKQFNQKEETYMVSFFLCYRFVSSKYMRCVDLEV